ncbi:hypothetical protein DYH09_07350 [bacterium CPR1]|nr:hypothetical protein [bacterium CPR1]
MDTNMNLGQIRSHELMRGIRAENCQDIAQTVARDSVESTRAWGGSEASELLKYDLRKLGTAVEQEVALRGGAPPAISPEQAAMAAGAILTAPLSGVIVYGLVEGLKSTPMKELASQVVDLVQSAPPELAELSLAVQGAVRDQVPSAYVPVTMLLAGAALENEQRVLDDPNRMTSSGFLQLQLRKANGLLDQSQAAQQARPQAQEQLPGWRAQRYSA